MNMSCYGFIVGVLMIILVSATGCATPSLPSLTPATPTQAPTQPVVNACGMENCHGLEIQCGAHPVDYCTAVFAEGDQCRSYASCQVVSGSCQPLYESRFDRCKNCVEMCSSQYRDSPMLMMDCQQKC